MSICMHMCVGVRPGTRMYVRDVSGCVQILCVRVSPHQMHEDAVSLGVDGQCLIVQRLGLAVAAPQLGKPTPQQEHSVGGRGHRRRLLGTELRLLLPPLCHEELSWGGTEHARPFPSGKQRQIKTEKWMPGSIIHVSIMQSKTSTNSVEPGKPQGHV